MPSPWPEVEPIVFQDMRDIVTVATHYARSLVQERRSAVYAVLLDHDGDLIVREAEGPPERDYASAFRAVKRSVIEDADLFRAVLLVDTPWDPETQGLRGAGDHRDGVGFAAWVRFRLNGELREDDVLAAHFEPLTSWVFG